MNEQFNYYKSYMIFKVEDRGYGSGKEPSGYIKIEAREGKGKLFASVQDLRGEPGKLEYKLYLLKSQESHAKPVFVGIIHQSKNRGDLSWEFNPANVSMSGSIISEFNIAVIKAEHLDASGGGGGCRSIFPLAAYRGEPVKWRSAAEEALWSYVENTKNEAITPAIYSCYAHNIESKYTLSGSVNEQGITQSERNGKHLEEDKKCREKEETKGEEKEEEEEGEDAEVKEDEEAEAKEREEAVVKEWEEVEAKEDDKEEKEKEEEEEEKEITKKEEEEITKEEGVGAEGKEEITKETELDGVMDSDQAPGEEATRQKEREVSIDADQLPEEYEPQGERYGRYVDVEQGLKEETINGTEMGEYAARDQEQIEEAMQETVLAENPKQEPKFEVITKQEREFEGNIKQDTKKNTDDTRDDARDKLQDNLQDSQQDNMWDNLQNSQRDDLRDNPRNSQHDELQDNPRDDRQAELQDDLQNNLQRYNCGYGNTGFCPYLEAGRSQSPCKSCFKKEIDSEADCGRSGNLPGNTGKFREYLDRYFESCNPFNSRKGNYKWWRVISPVYLNNILYQCNIKTPLLFDTAVIMAHFKYRHLIIGIYSDKARKKEYIVFGVPGVFDIDEKPFDDVCRWVQLEGYRPRYGAFGYWLIYLDVRNGKLLRVS